MHRCLFASIAACALAANGVAQCGVDVLPGEGVRGVAGRVLSIVEWDPDGPGPATPLIVVGGEFGTAGRIKAANIAAYDPASDGWSALGAGVDGGVSALTVLPSGELVVTGTFHHAGAAPARHIASWNGSAWSPLGAGLNWPGWNLVTLPNGDLVVGGLFDRAGGLTAHFIARWNGTTWAPCGQGLSRPPRALAALPNGNVVAAGPFWASDRLMQWNGTSWSSLASITGEAFSLLVTANGDLVAAGSLGHVGSLNLGTLARWNGTWTPIPGVQANNLLSTLVEDPLGNLYVGGRFHVAPYDPYLQGHVARWDGTTWTILGGGTNDAVLSLAMTSRGEVACGGYFSRAGNIDAQNVAIWNGVDWLPMAHDERSRSLRRIAELDDGTLAIAGPLVADDLDGGRSLATFAGGRWGELGSGAEGVVFDLQRMPNGDLIASGLFTAIDGVQANNIARWDGTRWHPMGAGVLVPTHCMAAMPNGDLVICATASPLPGSTSYLARWDGAAWSSLPGIPNGHAYALLATRRGELFAAGNGPLQRWDGTAWQPIFLTTIAWFSALAELPNGNMIVAGWMGEPGTVGYRVARFDGHRWSFLGGAFDDTIRDLAVLPSGDVVACGAFTTAGGVRARHLARWDGRTWSRIGGDLDGEAYAVHVTRSGDLVVLGDFGHVGDQLSAHLATLRSACPAAVREYGSACHGPAGTVRLSATTLPWLGNTCDLRAENFAANALGAFLFGSSPSSQPLSGLFAGGLPGCRLWLQPFAATVVVPHNGEAQLRLGIAREPALLGSQWRTQVLQLHVPPGAPQTLSSSAAVALRVGAF